MQKKPTYEELEERIKALENAEEGLKQAELALHESEEKYRSVVENANMGIIVIQEGKRVFYNPKLPEMLGYTDQEYQKLDFISTIHPEDKSDAIDRMKKRIMGEVIDPDIVQLRVLTSARP